jgi:hypothetical protein
MDADALAKAHQGSTALASLTAQQIKQVRLRYEAFFGQTRSTLDGSWTWEDTNAAYLLLDSLTLREETAGVARMIFEDFAHYFTTRKPRSQFALLIIDEFSSLAEGAEMAARIEQSTRLQHRTHTRPPSRRRDGRRNPSRPHPRLGRDRHLPPRQHPR